MGSGEKTAIIICNYNMPERTDKICEHLIRTIKLPYDLIVVDNGSDLVKPSKYTTVRLEKNRQTTGGFLAGFEYADSQDEDYFAYWTIITSAEFPENDDRDPLAMLLPLLQSFPKAYVVHPAVTFNHSPWSKVMSPQGNGFRHVNNIDYIAALFRAEYLNKIDRFRPELTYMWGLIGECNWKARKNGWELYIVDDYVIHKETDIGYTMDRMNMTAEERRSNASKQCDEILIPIYGENFRERHWNEYTK